LLGSNANFVNKWPESRQVLKVWILNVGLARTGNQVSTVHRVSGGPAVRRSVSPAVWRFGFAAKVDLDAKVVRLMQKSEF
jgi:hypothetical protein